MHITNITESVHVVTGTNVNWVLVTDGADVTLIDGGYPGDARAVEESVKMIGRDPSNIVGALLTHAHLDHVGGLPNLVAKYGTPVFMSEQESRHARREYLEQATAGEVLKTVTKPGGLKWTAQTLRAIGTKLKTSLPSAQAFPVTGSLDLPGSPVPVATPGHTRGHSSYFFPQWGIVVSGDTVVTGHPLSRRGGPQLLPSFFNADEDRTYASLDALRVLDADTLLPGHGTPMTGPMADLMGVCSAMSSSRATAGAAIHFRWAYTEGVYHFAVT